MGRSASLRISTDIYVRARVKSITNVPRDAQSFFNLDKEGG